MKIALALLAVVLLGVACSAKSASSGPTATYAVTFGPITVPAGIERTQCVIKRLGNPDAVRVGTFHNSLGEASHHLIVYRVNETVEQPVPFDCHPFRDALDPAKGSPLMITQKKDEVLRLPPGVAYTLDPNQMIRLEMHYINSTNKDVTLTSTSTMTTIADADFHDEAGFLFIGDPDITLPPHTKTTLGPTFFPLPYKYNGVKFFAITGHEHQFGTNVSVETAANKDAPGTPVYRVPDWSWAEPATVVQSPPFVLPDGGGFRFACDWNNTSDNEVKFGESATAEMCFFWAYYYPSQGSHVCFHTDQKGGVNICCPGDLLCGLLIK